MGLSKDMKIAICFGLIIGALISFCNMCFAAESEEVVINIANGLNLNSFDAGVSQITSGSYSFGYVEIEPGYEYTFYNGYTGVTPVAFGDSAPSVGDYVEVIGQISSGSSYSFNSNETTYMFFEFFDASGRTVTRTKLTGLSGFVGSIMVALSYINLNNIVANIVPILAISVLLGLGFYLLKRLLNRIKRAKGGV